MKRHKKRCPDCKPISIYRRIRRDGLSKLNKNRKAGSGKIYILARQYICHNCGHEFNNLSIDLDLQI